MNIIYLCAKKDRHNGVIHNDIIDYPGIDLVSDCATVDLSGYDLIIATPPCNWWSRANYRRNESIISLSTKLLLPLLYYKFLAAGKPFLIENVKSYTFDGYMPKPSFEHGRHYYWTNTDFNPTSEDVIDYISPSLVCRNNRDGDPNVHKIISLFIKKYVDNVNN